MAPGGGRSGLLAQAGPRRRRLSLRPAPGITPRRAGRPGGRRGARSWRVLEAMRGEAAGGRRTVAEKVAEALVGVHTPTRIVLKNLFSSVSV